MERPPETPGYCTAKVEEGRADCKAREVPVRDTAMQLFGACGWWRRCEGRTEAVELIKLPKTKELWTFLGLTGYYRRFVPDYSIMAAPLTDMTRKTQPNQVKWTPEGLAAFERMKKALCDATVLKTRDFTKKFVLQTDASDRGVGAVLRQQAAARRTEAIIQSITNNNIHKFHNHNQSITTAITNPDEDKL